jgi:hypothetical protein
MKHHWKERLTGNIDIWWIVGDGGALVLSNQQNISTTVTLQL